MSWFSRNTQGYWCDFCGECLAPDFDLESEKDWEDCETDLNDSSCHSCGAPDEFDPESV